MKKTLLSVAILLAFSTAKAQYQTRYNLANKDSVRTQIRMAAIEIASSYVDTATSANQRFCADILVAPTAGWFVDLFAYPLAAISQTATPTDAQVKAGILTLWVRSTLLNTRR